jgi:hypothetical protein
MGIYGFIPKMATLLGTTNTSFALWVYLKVFRLILHTALRPTIEDMSGAF